VTKRVVSALGLVLLSLAATGCPVMMDREQPHIAVTNDTRSPIVVSDDSGQVGTVPPGSTQPFIADPCIENLRVETGDNVLLAQEDKACEGATWTIRGPNDATLEP
jgi:hypothetical protein